MSRVPVLAVALLVAALVLAALPTSAQVPISAELRGNPAIAPGRPGSYNLSVSGGPGAQGNYTVQWHVTGPDPAGALPTAASPTSTTGNRTTFVLNITAPTKEQTITLVVKVTATGGSQTEETTVERSIVVITPIVLSATFRNLASTVATNVTVRFYVDGGLVGTKTIARLDGNGQATVTNDYLPIGLQSGTHQVRVEADLDGNGVIDPSRGEAIVSDTFYRGTQGLSTGWTVALAIVVFVPVLIATIALRRRQRA